MTTKCTSVHTPKRARCEEMAAEIVVLREQVFTLTAERDAAKRKADVLDEVCGDLDTEDGYFDLDVDAANIATRIHAAVFNGWCVRTRRFIMGEIDPPSGSDEDPAEVLARRTVAAARADVERLTKECEGLRAAPSARRIALMKEHRKLLIEDVTRLRAVLAEAELVVERHVPEPGDEIEDESGICEASTLEDIRDVLAATSASTTPPRWDV